MARDNDKHNGSPRGRRERPAGGSGRTGKPRGPEKTFAKRGFGGKTFDEERGGARARFRKDGEAPPFRRRDGDEASRRGNRDERRPKRFDQDNRPPRQDRAAAHQADRSGERKFRHRDDDRSVKGRGEDRGFRRPREDRDFRGRDRSDEKPWKKRDDRREDRGGDNERPSFSRSREDRPKFERHGDERPRFGRPRWERNGKHGDRDGEHHRERRPPPEGRMDWQEHPRSEPTGPRSARPDERLHERERFRGRPRRDNEDDSRIFAKRPAFGGRGAYRERPGFEKRPLPEPKPKKTGERIAKVLARAGLASRRDAEEMVTQGRVSVNGRIINSPALDVSANDVVAVDGKPLPPRERTRLFLYHKPRGLMTTHADPEGRPTVFDNLPEGLPRLISVGRLDFNTEGLLLLTNDGGLARVLEMPDTGWLRRYRVRAHGEITQAQLDDLKNGIEVDGIKYGPIDATLERDQGANVWLVFAIREGKNREVRQVMAHLGLEVSRLIRISYGPFQLGELEEGKVEEVKTRVLRDQLGEKVIAQAGCEFEESQPRGQRGDEDVGTPGKKRFKPEGRSALVNDRKGRRVLVQRTGSAEARARNEEENAGYGPPRRPKRGYHGKRDFKPRDE